MSSTRCWLLLREAAVTSDIVNAALPDAAVTSDFDTAVAAAAAAVAAAAVAAAALLRRNFLICSELMF